MIYIFEDDERDPIPQLFMKSYNVIDSSKFVYTRGNGNIYKIVVSKLSAGDTIVVYLDTIPGNIESRTIYGQLLRLSRKNNKSIIVLPIFGAEYYFIKSISNKPVVLDKSSVDICIDDRAYFGSSIIETQEDRKYCKYYERFCKLILHKSVIDCVRNTKDNGSNKQFRYYYTKDCKCETSLDICIDEKLLSKSYNLLQAYPCVPFNSSLEVQKTLSIVDIWDIHRLLVDKHNRLCDELANNDPDKSRIKAYKHINYI